MNLRSISGYQQPKVYKSCQNLPNYLEFQNSLLYENIQRLRDTTKSFCVIDQNLPLSLLSIQKKRLSCCDDSGQSVKNHLDFPVSFAMKSIEIKMDQNQILECKRVLLYHSS